MILVSVGLAIALVFVCRAKATTEPASASVNDVEPLGSANYIVKIDDNYKAEPNHSEKNEA